MLDNIALKSYRNTGNNDVLKFITEGSEVLDIGCGGGDNARNLQETGCMVDGITISATELNEAKNFLREGFLYDLENGLPDNVIIKKYDFIICSHVLEHICYPEKLLNGIKNCLRPGGKFIVALPNIMHYKSRWELCKGNFNYKSAGIWDNTHFKWYTYESGAELLQENGFKIIEKTVTGQLPGASFFSKLLSEKISLILYDKIKKISPGFFGYQLLYVATI